MDTKPSQFELPSPIVESALRVNNLHSIMLAFKSYLVTQQMQTQELPGAIQESCDLGKKAESLEG